MNMLLTTDNENGGTKPVKTERLTECHLSANQTFIPIYNKLTLTIREAALYSNIGINKLEDMLRSPRCPFVLYVGKKKLVKRKEFEKYIADHVEI